PVMCDSLPPHHLISHLSAAQLYPLICPDVPSAQELSTTSNCALTCGDAGLQDDERFCLLSTSLLHYARWPSRCIECCLARWAGGFSCRWGSDSRTRRRASPTLVDRLPVPARSGAGGPAGER